jgi:hypothetical protein
LAGLYSKEANYATGNVRAGSLSESIGLEKAAGMKTGKVIVLL